MAPGEPREVWAERIAQNLNLGGECYLPGDGDEAADAIHALTRAGQKFGLAAREWRGDVYIVLLPKGGEAA